MRRSGGVSEATASDSSRVREDHLEAEVFVLCVVLVLQIKQIV